MSDRHVLSGVFRRYPAETGGVAFLLFGLLAFGALADSAQAFSGLLAAAIFTLSLALGAAVFIAIQGVSGARWWAPVRGVASSAASAFVVPAAALAITLAAGLPVLYVWARPLAVHDPALAGKLVWLNAPMFLGRALVILLAWGGLVALLRRRVAALDAKETDARPRFTRASVAFLLLLAPTLSVASWDWVMSLEPRFASTMFSVYGFAGTFLSGIAVVAALAVLFDRAGLLAEPLTPSVRHDLGKLLFAFSMFWAYIWFCQYLLVWYSNLPEETPYYALRSHFGWTALFWLVPVLQFGVPFAALLSGAAKKRADALGTVAILVLLGRFLDEYVRIAPAAGGVPSFPVYAVAATLLLLVGMAFAFDRAFRASTKEVTLAAPVLSAIGD